MSLLSLLTGLALSTYSGLNSKGVLPGLSIKKDGGLRDVVIAENQSDKIVTFIINDCKYLLLPKKKIIIPRDIGQLSSDNDYGYKKAIIKFSESGKLFECKNLTSTERYGYYVFSDGKKQNKKIKGVFCHTSAIY